MKPMPRALARAPRTYTHRHRRRSSVTAARWFNVPITSCPNTTMMNLPRVRLTVNDEQLDAYVARNEEDRALGLMHRRDLPENEGMLFVCDEACEQRFWMKDTPLPLSIAFIEEDGTICRIADLQPHCLDAESSGQPVRFILEVNQGWFAERGIEAGARLVGPVFTAALASP